MQTEHLYYTEKLLLAKILGVDLNDIFTHQYQINSDQESEFEKKKELLNQGYPLDYLLGSVRFLDLDFDVTEQVLIPRPETEDWVSGLQHVFSNPQYQSYNLVDVGCGSGVIGLSLAKYFKHVFLVDVSDSALQIAKQNGTKLNIKNTEFILSNLIEFIIKSNLDLKPWILVANLPYVPESDKQFKQENNISYEPEMAIFSGSDGLDLFRELIKQLEMIEFKPEKCLFELDTRNVVEASKLLGKLYKNVFISADCNGLNRFLSGSD